MTAGDGSMPEKIISLVGLKKIMSRLPEGSTVRQVILSEPDELPASVGYEKLKLYGRLYYKEMNLT